MNQLTEAQKENLLKAVINTLPASHSEIANLSETLHRKGIENLAIIDEASALEIVVKELEWVRKYHSQGRSS
jgi:hypothetical protein